MLNKGLLTVIIFSFLISSISYRTNAEVNEDGFYEIPSNFNLFTSENLKGYTKPIFTTIGQGFQSNLFTRAKYSENWSIGMDLSLSSTIIPSSQKTYQAQLPEEFGNPTIVDNAELRGDDINRNLKGTVEQPTFYGGESYTVYGVAPVEGGSTGDSIYKTITFAEGSRISTMASTPALQLIVGMPTRTELRIRYLGAPAGDEMFNHFGFAVNQQIDHFADLFKNDPSMGLALNLSYQFSSLSESLNMTSWSAGVHFSKAFNNGLAVYSGLQIEDLSGKFKVVRTNGVGDPDSPYKEIRDGDPLEFDIESFTSWRLLVGGSYELGIVEFHLDLGYASQPFVNGGLRVRFKEWSDDAELENLEN